MKVLAFTKKSFLTLGLVFLTSVSVNAHAGVCDGAAEAFRSLNFKVFYAGGGEYRAYSPLQSGWFLMVPAANGTCSILMRATLDY